MINRYAARTISTASGTWPLSLLGVIAHDLEEAPRAMPDMHVFSRYLTNMPWLSHAELDARAMVDAGQLARRPDLRDLGAIYRPDLFRKAAATVAMTLPYGDLAPDDDGTTNWNENRSAEIASSLGKDKHA